MIIHNSLTKKHEEVVPLKAGQIGLYSCGPTVYNNLHIGNLSAFIYADMLRRALSSSGYDVTHVMNITDVDDKTIRDSKAAEPDNDPMTALKKLTEKYTDVFKKDLAATGNDLHAITFISAVDTVPEMIELTQKLLDNDIAYVADDAVYFSITKYYQAGHTYGALQKVATQQSKARIANDEYDKDSASDFALWKRSEDGEPAWDAKFSEDGLETIMSGRPGWHIECSAMSEKLLGTPFDIHTGGIDLKFPHHENEIAQSIGSGAEGLAKYFVHNNHILVDGKKMSKSLGNFYTLRDIEDKGFDAITFRLMVLESHYHSEANFSWEILEAAKNRLRNWRAIIDTQFQLPESDDISVIKDITTALQDNLNTPNSLKAVDGYFDKVSSAGQAPNSALISALGTHLGLEIDSTDITDDQKKLLEQRSTARAEKKWEDSDRLRDILAEQGVVVRDDAAGQIWSRN